MKYKSRQIWFREDDRELATFIQRAVAILIDFAIIIGLYILVGLILNASGLAIEKIELDGFHLKDVHGTGVTETNKFYVKAFLSVMPFLYFILFVFLTNGFTPGKWLLGIRIVSLYHQRISLWHCIERALGYVASTLEFGLGFIQIFWNPNRMCLHDRIAETIVSKSGRVKHKKAVHHTAEEQVIPVISPMD